MREGCSQRTQFNLSISLLRIAKYFITKIHIIMAKHDFKSLWLRSAAMLSLGLMLGATAEAQIVEKRSFASQNEIQALDNTTFCTAFLANNQVYTLRDIQVCTLTGID